MPQYCNYDVWEKKKRTQINFINTIITQLGHNAFPGETSCSVDSLPKCLNEFRERELFLETLIYTISIKTFIKNLNI